MIRVELPSRTIGLSFKHISNPPYSLLPYDISYNCPHQISHRTWCIIYEIKGEDAAELSHGKADCSILDNFNKSKGRKIALERAMHQLHPGNGHPVVLGKAERQQVWDTYRATVRN